MVRLAVLSVGHLNIHVLTLFHVFHAYDLCRIPYTLFVYILQSKQEKPFKLIDCHLILTLMISGIRIFLQSPIDYSIPNGQRINSRKYEIDGQLRRTFPHRNGKSNVAKHLTLFKKCKP